MKNTEQIIASDGTCLNKNTWIIENPKQVICLAHGLGDHMDRYDHFGEFLNENQIILTGIDQRGHGKTKGIRGHASFEQLTSDFDLLIADTIKKFPGIPLFIYGHSMGGNLVANYVVTDPFQRIENKQITGAILSAPWLSLAMKVSNVEIKGSEIFSKIFPSLTLPNRLKPEYLSNDETVVEAYIEDPLVHNKISLKLFSDAYNYGQKAIAEADKAGLDVYVFHGNDDNITSIESSEKFATHTPNGTFKIWENTRHEPHNDTRKEEVMMSVVEWVQSLS